jgi:hypothetical protein
MRCIANPDFIVEDFLILHFIIRPIIKKPRKSMPGAVRTSVESHKREQKENKSIENYITTFSGCAG